MNTKLTNRSVLAAALLLAWVGSAPALSLGPVNGATVIGRPLELNARIRFDDLAAAAGSECVGAELLYGDKPVSRGKVKLELVPDGARQTSIAKISSSELVNEPVVTLVLRAGCNGAHQSIRRYVLLADAPRDEPVILGAASSLALAAAPVDSQPVALAAATAVSPARSVMPKAAGRPAVATGTQETQVAARTAVPARNTVSRPGGRLQLALWEPRTDQSPWLRASTELRSLPSADAAQRAAAAALWRALNADPQDLLRTAERLRGLEAEISSLRSLALRHRGEISSARESLQQAQARRHTSLGLAALLALLAGGSAAFFWNRSRRRDPVAAATSWYAPIEPYGDRAVDDESEPASLAPGAQTGVAAVVPPQVLPPPEAEPQPRPGVEPSRPRPQPMVSPSSVAPSLALDAPLEFTLPDVPVAEPAVVRVDHGARWLKVDALHGAQQQSEFFVSLGQFDEGAAVLDGYLQESSEKPVLAFLELFRIYHGVGLLAPYQELQAEFRRAFGFDFSSFGEFRDEPRELETYPAAVSRIAMSWPSARSQETIEELLFKRPAGQRDLLSLHAYRELLWLYALGQDIVYSTGMPAGLQLLGDVDLPNNHFILPWADGEQRGPAELSLDRLSAIDVAPDLNGFGVDIDLTSLPEIKGQEDQAAASDFDAFDAAMQSESRRHSR